MSKNTGLGARLFVAGFDVSGDIGMVDTIRGGPNLLDLTGIDQLAFDREGGIFDSEIGFKAFWNVAANQEHAAFKTLPISDRHVAYLHGVIRGNACAWQTGKQMNYDPTRGQDGSMMEAVQFLQNGFPLYWGVQLTAGKQLVASASNLTSIDRQVSEGIPGVSTVFGASALLQVFSLASGTADISIHDSADNSVFTFVTGMAFNTVAIRTTQQVQTATGATIRRYVRVVTASAFTNLVLFVGFVGHQTSTI